MDMKVGEVSDECEATASEASVVIPWILPAIRHLLPEFIA